MDFVTRCADEGSFCFYCYAEVGYGLHGMKVDHSQRCVYVRAAALVSTNPA